MFHPCFSNWPTGQPDAQDSVEVTDTADAEETAEILAEIPAETADNAQDRARLVLANQKKEESEAETETGWKTPKYIENCSISWNIVSSSHRQQWLDGKQLKIMGPGGCGGLSFAQWRHGSSSGESGGSGIPRYNLEER